MKSEGNKFAVTLFDAPGTAVPLTQRQRPGVSTASTKTEGATFALRDVDFRRGQAGEGRVIVDLSDANSGIDIKPKGKVLIVDFLRTQVPRNLERKLDVSDFGTL